MLAVTSVVGFNIIDVSPVLSSCHGVYMYINNYLDFCYACNGEIEKLVFHLPNLFLIFISSCVLTMNEGPVWQNKFGILYETLNFLKIGFFGFLICLSQQNKIKIL